MFSKNILSDTKIAIWKIEEPEAFFSPAIQLQQTAKHPYKRLQHLAGRYLLSLLYADFPYSEIKINEARKPYLPAGQYSFSISHSRNYAAAIMSATQQTGIDIEMSSSKTQLVKHKFLSFAELTYINTLQTDFVQLFHDDNLLYTLCWCAKEAVYKWWGTGGIDFKKHIVLHSIHVKEQQITILFTKGIIQKQLTLQFIWLPQLCTVWLST